LSKAKAEQRSNKSSKTTINNSKEERSQGHHSRNSSADE
jgi:hypothetical protein